MVRDFVGTLADAGVEHFIVHARNAWLKGLSPKENREIPPLRYEVVYQLKQDFPELNIALNGGVTTAEQIRHHWNHVDGVMIGREAWHNPWSLTQWDGLMAGEQDRAVTLTRDEVELAMVAYMEREAAQYDTWWYAVARSMLGLRHGQRGARRWRQVWSDHRLKGAKPREVYDLAQKALHSSPPVLEEDVH